MGLLCINDANVGPGYVVKLRSDLVCRKLRPNHGMLVKLHLDPACRKSKP